MHADNSGECVRQTETRSKAKFDKVRRHPGRWTDDPEISHESQTEAASDCCSLHGCDDRLLAAE